MIKSKSGLQVFSISVQSIHDGLGYNVATRAYAGLFNAGNNGDRWTVTGWYRRGRKQDQASEEKSNIAAADLQIHISHISYNGNWADVEDNAINLVDAMRREQDEQNRNDGGNDEEAGEEAANNQNRNDGGNDEEAGEEAANNRNEAGDGIEDEDGDVDYDVANVERNQEGEQQVNANGKRVAFGDANWD